MEVGAITSFTGEYHWLSNFYQADPFVWRNVSFTSGEQAFQYAKGFAARNPGSYFEDMLATDTPSKAKYLGRSVKIELGHWEAQKVWYMREIVHAKFSQCMGLAGKLINTGAVMLIEGNDWGDQYWGRTREGDKWVGHNVLGVILMEERGKVL